MHPMTRFGYFSAAFLLLLVIGIMVFAPNKATEFGVAIERSMAGLSLAETEADGFTMPYLHGGEGPPLVLLHGFSANKDNFTRVARHLQDDFSLVIPDLPGFGDASAPQDGDYTLEVQVQRVLAFLDALELDEPVHLGGSSMGGYLAAATALAAPDRVASLWLLAPAGFVGEQRSEVRLAFEDHDEVQLLPRDEQDFARVLEMVFHKQPRLPWFVRATLAEQAVARHDHYARIFRQINDSPALNDRAAEIPVPTLLVWGDKDRVLHPSGAEVVRSANPEVEILLMPDIGHLPMMEAPRDSADALLDFHRRHFAS